jgi:hypothetical protein
MKWLHLTDLKSRINNLQLSENLTNKTFIPIPNNTTAAPNPLKTLKIPTLFVHLTQRRFRPELRRVRSVQVQRMDVRDVLWLDSVVSIAALLALVPLIGTAILSWQPIRLECIKYITGNKQKTTTQLHSEMHYAPLFKHNVLKTYIPLSVHITNNLQEFALYRIDTNSVDIWT